MPSRAAAPQPPPARGGGACGGAGGPQAAACSTGRHAGKCGGRPALRVSRHACLRVRSLAVVAVVRSVRTHKAPARRPALFGAGGRGAGKRQSADRPARHHHRAGGTAGRCGAEGALPGAASLRGAVCRLHRFLAVAHPAAGWPVCRRLRPCAQAARRRSRTGPGVRRRHRHGRSGHYSALQRRSSGRAGRHRRHGRAAGAWSRSMSMAATSRRASA